MIIFALCLNLAVLQDIIERIRYNKTKKQIERRVRNNRENRAFGTYGNYDGKDVSHRGRKIVLESEHKNRGSKTNTPGDKRARGKKGKGRRNKGNKGGT